MSEKVPYTIKSVQKALRLLKSFITDNTEKDLSKIASINNLPKSTAHRLLRTLEIEGFISQNKISEQYSLGVGLLELAKLAMYNINIQKIISIHMEQLTAAFGESTHFGILNDRELVTIQVNTPAHHNLTYGIPIGTRSPLYCTATGKAILAFQPEEMISEYLKRKRVQFTENTIIKKTDLLRELEKIRAQGYAADNMEHEPGIRCVAAPIRNHTGEVYGGLSISGPVLRVNEERIKDLSEAAKEATRKISLEIGCPSTFFSDPPG